MAVTTAPGARRSLVGAALNALSNRSKARTGRPSRVAAAIGQHLMTFAGLAAVDFAAFHAGHAWGWAATGVSILLADFKIQG